MAEDRGTGRTTRQLEALPDGAVYLVAFERDIPYCRGLLVSMGRASDAIRFVPLSRMPEALMGLQRSTVLGVDHFVYSVIDEKQRALLRMFMVRYVLPPTLKKSAA